MVNVGNLHRRIRIEQVTLTQDGYGEPIKTWALVDHVWADVRAVRREERFAAQQVGRVISLRMRMHYRVDITERMRVLYEGTYYNVEAVTELGERAGLELLVGLWEPEE